jgi:putative FmdB family regulatory protein
LPLYEYDCPQCGRFEKIRKFADRPLKVCPTCGKRGLERLLSAPAIQFKGTGWYINDYAKPGSKSEPKSPDSQSSEAKSADAKGDGTAGKSEGKSEGTSPKDAGKSEASSKSSDKSSDTSSGSATPAKPA